jgi:hypothetical protein
MEDHVKWARRLSRWPHRLKLEEAERIRCGQHLLYLIRKIIEFVEKQYE